jgi:hypothetical protein
MVDQKAERVTWSLREVAGAISAILLFMLIAWVINSDRPDLASLLSGNPQTASGGHSRNGSLLRLGTGDVQVTLLWRDDVDLDLYVTDPRGETMWYQNPRSSTGGMLDVDANAACESSAMMTNPVENIFWPYGGAPTGHFVVKVNYYADCIRRGTVSFTIRLKVDERTTEYPGTVTFENQTVQVTTFDR